MTAFSWDMTVTLQGGGHVRLEVDDMDLEDVSEAEAALVRSMVSQMEDLVGLRAEVLPAEPEAEPVAKPVEPTPAVAVVAPPPAPPAAARPGNAHVPGEIEPIEDRTCKFCGDVKDTVHGLRVHVGRKHKNEPLDTPAPVNRAFGSSDEIEETREAPTGIAQPVGVINGVCGPCRRLHCQLCVTEGCKCMRPGHWTVSKARPA